MPFTIQLTADKAEKDSAYIEEQLRRFNLQHAEPDQHTLMRIFARNEQGELVGGLRLVLGTHQAVERIGDDAGEVIVVQDLPDSADTHGAGLFGRMPRIDDDGIRFRTGKWPLCQGDSMVR